MQNALRDTRIALRLLRKRPGFTAIAIMTIALGIAANTAIFSVIYATFVEPLPYRDADRLVMVWSIQRDNRGFVSAREFVEWKRQATTFDALNAWSWMGANVSFGGRPERMQIAPATPGFLPMLGYGHPLALGRDFLEEEGTPGKDQVVILTHRIWRERLGSDPKVIGRQIRVDRKLYTVVGVLGAGPPDDNQSQMWTPLALTEAEIAEDSRPLLVMGRLRGGVTRQQANANLVAVSDNIARTQSARVPRGNPSVEPFRNNFLGNETKQGLWLLLGAVVFLLLIACANVANLLLARGTARQRELAVRSSVGASRSRIVRQLMVESLVLAIIGGVLGIVLASALLKVVITLMPPYMLPTEAHVRLNIPVLAFTFAASALAGLLFGAAPAWNASRVSITEILKDAGRTAVGGGNRLRQALVIVEFALALSLLSGGGLAVYTLFKLATRDPGFPTDHLLTFSVPIPRDHFAADDAVTNFYRQFLERVQAAPGVLSASVSTGLPIRGTWGRVRFSIAGKPEAEESKRPLAAFSMVTPSYFETFRIPVTRGRVFREQDRRGSLPVVIVNETFVKQYLADVDPLDQRLVLPQVGSGTAISGTTEWRIVGVCRDVLNTDPSQKEIPEIHVPFWQMPATAATVAVRTAVDPAAVQHTIAGILQSIDPELPIDGVRTMDQIVAESLVRDRFNTVLFGSFALAGLLLAAFGIYGVMSFGVAQRTREIGLRIALGADRSHILRSVVAEGMVVALIGTAAGLLGAFYVVRTMRGVLADTGGFDALALSVVTVTLLASAFLACIVPAARAASVDPMTALRQD